MPKSLKPPVPEEAAPPIVAAFVNEFVANADKEYALLKDNVSLGERCETSLFDFQMETLIFGLHCLDRAVFAHWGPEYRAAFMDCAFSFACEAFSDVLPDSQCEAFLEGFKKHCDTRQAEYGAMKLLPCDDGTPKGVLWWEFAKRICIDARVFNPPVQIVLMDWAGEIMKMMLRIAEKL